MHATIQFIKYYVSKIDFRYNPKSDEVPEGSVNFKHEIEYQGNDVKVTLICNVSDEAGLQADVELVGIFTLDTDSGIPSDSQYIKNLCERNTLSILFPYLRSIVSDLSLKANMSPIILPTINILALLGGPPETEEETMD